MRKRIFSILLILLIISSTLVVPWVNGKYISDNYTNSYKENIEYTYQNGFLKLFSSKIFSNKQLYYNIIELIRLIIAFMLLLITLPFAIPGFVLAPIGFMLESLISIAIALWPLSALFLYILIMIFDIAALISGQTPPPFPSLDELLSELKNIKCSIDTLLYTLLTTFIAPLLVCMLVWASQGKLSFSEAYCQALDIIENLIKGWPPIPSFVT